ncbi:hotdog fold thioesterase [Virgibacillus halophilus]|uniref:Hotdog fold thioesterase n=1 Tax=Tigheibacillus halophilus TaxID=361280 RepID=A0ABU5C1H1_9BACI|nr:hotdog fold thioesterase [Virgibacillus halophilus]
MNWDNTLLESLGIEVISAEKEQVVVKMPVDQRTRQPAGFLHGGASAALAETAASIGAVLQVNPEKYDVFGIEINANHIHAKRNGEVTACATPLHVGKTTMVWQIHISDEQNRLICVSRCTIGVVLKRG